MFKKLFILLAIAAAMWQPISAQTAPDLGILWQKEYPGIDIQFAKFSKDGQFVYFASDKKIGIMSAETGELLPGFDLIMDFAAEDLNITQDGKYLAVTTGSSTTYILNTITKELVKEFSEKTLDAVKIIYHSDISPDGNFLYLSILGNDDYFYILIYNVQEDKEVKRLLTEGHVSKIKSTHDGRYFAAGIAYKDIYEKWYNKLILWETGTWKEVAVLEDVEGHNSGYRNIEFSFNDNYLGSTRLLPNDVHIFSLQSKKLIKTTEPSKLCGGILFLPDNQHFLLAFYDENINERTIELHDFEKMLNFFPFYCIATLNVYDDNSNWKIFGSLVNNIAMLTNKPNTVIETNPDNNINLFYEYDKIILQTIILNSLQINISVTDIAGKTIFQEKISDVQANSKIIIDIELPSGIYLVKATANNKNYTFKIEVAR
jgi:hypothetical protein